MSLTPEILALDLAALRTLRLVYRHRSFAEAAQELGMNPSSISYTIDRVRKAAGDPLFVRQGGVISATDHCRSLMESVEAILLQAENIQDNQEFNPAQTEDEVSIYGSVLIRQVLLPPVLERLRNEAPGIRLHLIFGYSSVRDLLLQGKVDIAIVPEMFSDSGIHCHEGVLEDRHVCLMDPSHPLAYKPSLGLEDIAEANHVHYEPVPGWQQAHFRHAANNGVKLRKIVRSSESTVLGELIVGTDLISALPTRLALTHKDTLALREFNFETPVSTHMYWTAASHRSKVNRWIRTLIEDVAGQLSSTPKV